MRRSLLIGLLLAVSQAVWAQIPQTMSYQGVLTDVDGDPVSDGAYGITFAIHDAASAGTQLWSEAHTVQVTDGVFHIILGSLSPLTLPFDAPYWLGMTVGVEELPDRTELTASAYALMARSVEAGSIGTDELADGSVTSAKLATDVALVQMSMGSLDDLSGLTPTQSGLTGFNAEQVFDGIADNQGWHTDVSTPGAWLRVDLPSPKEYTRTRIFGQHPSNPQASKWMVQYSDDGTNWVPVAFLYGGFVGWNDAIWPAVGAHSHWRLVLANSPGSGPWIGEWELYVR